MSKIPVPFPEDTSTHPLLILDINSLKNKNQEELDKLWDACTSLGFFYLKGFDTSIPDSMFDLAERTLALPLEEKREWDQGKFKSSYGYKGLGDAIVDEKGTTDLNEFWNTSKDDILNYPTIIHRNNPIIIQNSIPELQKFLDQSYYGIVRIILECLEEKLGLNKGVLLDMHDIMDTSGDQVRFIKAPPRSKEMSKEQAALGAHTDFGSVTVLHNRLGGLQVLVPGTEEWQYIKPLPGHAIINLGDSLSILTCSKLRSNTHRVVEPPGNQSKYTRYSCVYFNRPSDEVILKPLRKSKIVGEAAIENGKSLDEDYGTAKDWIDRRVRNRRKDHYVGPETYYASRGTEHQNNPGIQPTNAG